MWRLLRDDPDRYIYSAVGHGVTWNARQPEAPVPLDIPFELPDDIAGGIGDVAQRGGWNAQAPEKFALPTETWREVVARRTRYAEVRDYLASGKVQEISDFITLNLDVERFAGDVISQSEGPELLRAFWHAMRDVSVLDPTCGSGAFLFAALNILEPLYTACLEACAASWTMPKGPNARAALDILRTSATYWTKRRSSQRALLHPQIHRSRQSVRRGHHGGGCRDL